MKKIVLVAFVGIFAGCSGSETATVGEPAFLPVMVHPPDSVIGKYPTPRDPYKDSVEAVRLDEATFHRARVENMIRYLALRTVVRKQIDRYEHSKNNIQRQAGPVLDEILFWEDGCQYDKLNAVEREEMFEKRLKNHPNLLKFATRTLRRNVKAKGFGFQVGGAEAMDYYASDQAESLGSKKMQQMLKSAHVTSCGK